MVITGERQYEQRVEDIRLLRLEVIRLRKEKNLLSKGIENMTDLRLEVMWEFSYQYLFHPIKAKLEDGKVLSTWTNFKINYAIVGVK